MPADQLEGIDDGAVQGVVRAELERTQQQWQHATIVGAVRVADDRLEMASIDGGRGFSLGHQVVQGGFAGDGEDDVAHRAVGSGQARRCQLEQQRRLTRDSLEVGDQLALDPLFGLGSDAMDGGDQKVDERVCDLAGAHVAEGGKQGRPHRCGMAAQLAQLLGGDAPSMGAEYLGRHALDQVGRQADGSQSRELGDFVGHALQARPSRPGAQHEKWSAAGVLGLLASRSVKQSVKPRDRFSRQPGKQRRAEGGIVAPYRRAYQPFQTIPRGRLNPQCPASLPGRHGQAIGAPIVGEDLALEPAAQGLGILERGLAEAEGAADLGTVIGDRATAPFVMLPLDCRDLDLASDCLHRRDGHVLDVPWKPAFGLEHLQKHGKAQSGDATLVGQKRVFGLAQCPTVLDVVRLAAQHCLPPIKRPNCSAV